MKIINAPCGITKAMRNILANTSILLIVLAILPVSATYADITALERAALIALYNSTDGDNWANKTGWETATPGTECEWYGVTCTGDAVTNLSLNYNDLTGTIPPELGNLDNLTYLSLIGNVLTGSIPAELGNLSNISRIFLPENQLTGPIPAELSNLSTLTRLYLNNNQITGSIPAELGNLTGLQILWLNDNQLSGRIPTELVNLSSLGDLNICDNHLYAIDPDLRDFLDTLQPGWEDCQTPPFGKPMPSIPLLLLDD